MTIDRHAYLLAAALTLAVAARPAPAGEPAEGGKNKAPALDIRAVPRMSFSPANVLLVAELKGGDDSEDYYCLAVEWDFDDGAKSTHGADCAPYQAGATIERRFTAEHRFERAGNYDVRVTLKRSDKVLKKGSVRVTVRPGLADPSNINDSSGGW
jgi:nucleoid-associated protein YgaU